MTGFAPSRNATLILATALLAGGCATTAAQDRDALRSRELQQLAQSLMTDSGNVNVKVEGDEGFVYGSIASAIDERRILQTVGSAEGINVVRNGLHREM